MIPIVDFNKTFTDGSESSVLCALQRKGEQNKYDDIVRPIIEAVREGKDSSLLRFAQDLDGLGDQPMRVAPDEFTAAAPRRSPEVRAAAKVAISNIRQFAQAQLPREHFSEFGPGRSLGW